MKKFTPLKRALSLVMVFSLMLALFPMGMASAAGIADGSSAPTGDNSGIQLWIAAMVLSLIAVVLLLILMAKSNKKNKKKKKK